MNTRCIAEEHRLAHWARIMKERAESGLSIRAYCANAGFHENNYFYWQKKLREAACEELALTQGNQSGMVPTRFAEVKLPSRVSYPTAAGYPQSQVCIETANGRITADGEYPVDKLLVLMREATRQC